MKDKKLFPQLSKDQIQIFEEVGKHFSFEQGDVLIQDGVKNFDFFVITNGVVDILDPTKDDAIITKHKAGEFTGDSDMLSHRASLFRAVASSKGEAIKVSHDDLQEIIAHNPELSDILIRAFLERRAQILEDTEAGITILGSSTSPETFQIREFLSKNHYRYHWLDTDKEQEADDLIKQYHINPKDLPILINAKEEVFRKPSLDKIAQCTGLAAQHSDKVYDLLIVGAGPGGLAASVYAASEGINTITIDSIGPGGQAGRSSKIENYLGFPIGISGSDLANRAYVQAQKFGCTISVPFTAKKLAHDGHCFVLTLHNEDQIKAAAVIAATGAKYRKLGLSNENYYAGRGIYYAATAMELRTCMEEEVAIVGGGNSAGQAAMYLSQHVKHVHLFIRKDTLKGSMSSYLIERIKQSPHITLETETEITGLAGEKALETIETTHNPSGEKQQRPIKHLFLFIGAEPSSAWLSDLTCLSNKGFVYTGTDLNDETLKELNWPLIRRPFTLETCAPGLLAIGDLRYNSTKRVASAVGEGAMAVSYVHRYLREYREKLKETTASKE